jgi:tetratricopeptide (TPR) repeat protein
VLLCALLSHAATPVAAQNVSSHAKLETCISEYKDGNYRKAAENLKALLPFLSSMEDQVEAYKYLGFSYGMLNWIDKSKDVFKTGLDIYPAMTIDTLEVPPNITIIFKQAKLEKKLEKIETTNAKPPKIIVKRKNVVLPALLLSAGILSAGASVDLFYYGNQQHQKYKAVNTPNQDDLDKYFRNYQNGFIAGAACACITAVLVPVSIRLFMKKEIQMSVSLAGGMASVVYTF